MFALCQALEFARSYGGRVAELHLEMPLWFLSSNEAMYGACCTQEE